MPPWPSRLISPYSSYAYSQSTDAGASSNSLVGSPSPSTSNDLAGTKLPFGHLRSQSQQVTYGGGRGQAARGRTSDAALRRDKEGADLEFTTGKCFCCDSTVGWPSSLTVFRCMVCLSVNDLKPTQTLENKPAMLPITLEATKAVINRCIQELIGNEDGVKRISEHSAPQVIPAAADTVPDNIPLTVPQENEHLKGTCADLQNDCSTSTSTRLLSSSNTSPTPLPISSMIDGGQPRPSLSPLLNEEVDLLAHGDRDPVSLRPRIEEYSKKQTLESLEKGNGTHDALSQHKEIEEDRLMRVLKPLEDYISACFSSWECINSSFLTKTAEQRQNCNTIGEPEDKPSEKSKESEAQDNKGLTEGQYEGQPLGGKGFKRVYEKQKHRDKGIMNIKDPALDWSAAEEFYDLIIEAPAQILGASEQGEILKVLEEKEEEKECESDIFSEKLVEKSGLGSLGEGREISELLEDIKEAKWHITRVVLKATENLLKRPGRPLKEPGDIRFLLIVLSNPLLYSSSTQSKQSITLASGRTTESLLKESTRSTTISLPTSKVRRRSVSPSAPSGPGRFSGIIKRILGLISNLPNICHHYLVSWFSRMPENQFRQLVELGGSFITYRLTRQHDRKKLMGGNKKGKGVVYDDDWQIRAAARYMALLFSANINGAGRPYKQTTKSLETSSPVVNPVFQARHQARARGQIVPTSDFYNMLLDYSDLIADFEAWEGRSSKFCFCQYPFLFSMGAKIHILEHDARRQMEVKAREAFFTTITTQRPVNQYLVLKVRRECLVEDSLKGISEGVGGIDEIKKGLKIEFVGEDGVDAGGLRKEWFLLLVRDLFDPNYGMFTYDEDSRYCYFNPNSLETSEEFFLVGAVIGLAIYNSTILDVAFPPCVFKKLLQTAPSNLQTSSLRPPFKHTLDDLAVFRPALANGLRQLLEFEGNVEEVFCRSFSIDTERFGQRSIHALIRGGENVPVTNANRREFVDKYIAYLLDTSVAKQFEPFKRGFYTVCGGNALSLFRPEELELLVRGSDEPLDIAPIRAVAVYENWGNSIPPENDPVVKWFWNFFERITPAEQRQLLGFITGSDRIPAMGGTHLVIKLVCMGPDCDRFPIARTCFNALYIHRYQRREKLEKMLWTAVQESAGFGLK